MSAQHTPAPWLAAAKPSSIVGWPVVGPEGRLICNLAWQPKPEHVDAATYDAFYREVQANAHLIAAAPELLAATREGLIMVEADIEQRENELREEGGDPATDYVMGVFRKRRDLIAAAIAKAEGRS